MIPRSSVLNGLKDSKSGEIIDFDWGVDQWSSLLLKSDEQHPVGLEEPAIFDPRLLGTHEACTGLYACQTHDAVFNRIDTATPDFGDSHIRWLTMGGIALYAADLCSRRKFLVDTWKWKTMRGDNKGLRARENRRIVGCQRFWTVLGPRDWGEEAPGLRVSLTS